jgi:hypothetical protein
MLDQVQENVDRLVSVGDTRAVLQKRMTPTNDKCPHPLGHTLGISSDEADLVEQDGLRSNNVYALWAIGISGTLAASKISKLSHMA